MYTGMGNDTPTKKIIEPVTSLYDEGKYFRIIVQLRGIPEEKIRIDLEKTTITISVTYDGKRYKKDITIPSEARLSKKRFINGSLELILEKSDEK